MLAQARTGGYSYKHEKIIKYSINSSPQNALFPTERDVMTTSSSKNDLPRLTYSIAEVGEMFGISRSTIYSLMRDGKLNATKIVNKTMFTRDEIARFTASLEAA